MTEINRHLGEKFYPHRHLLFDFSRFNFYLCAVNNTLVL